jgi:hypothetical protein
VLFYVPDHGDYHPMLWGRTFPSAAAGVEALTRDLAPGSTIAIVPDGPYVLARAPEDEPLAA